MAIQAVGGWVRYRWEARPSNASRPCSSSNVPSGSPTWACFETRPFDSGNMCARLPLLLLPRLPVVPTLARLAGSALLVGPLTVVGPPDLLPVSPSHFEFLRSPCRAAAP